MLKTGLDALTSYIQDIDRLEGWMFINFIALHIFYMIRKRIVGKGSDLEDVDKRSITYPMPPADSKIG